LAAGRDITDLFNVYHPFTDKPAKVIDKFFIGNIKTTEFPQYVEDRGFYRETRAAVGAYFRQTGKDPKDPIPGLLRLAVFLSLGLVCFLISHGPRWVESFLLLRFNVNVHFSLLFRCCTAFIFGCCQALPLLHTMHDASHLSFGWNAKWWTVAGRFLMDWVCGASILSWSNQHVLGHHVYTNVMGVDPDLPPKLSGDIRRVANMQSWNPIYRFQHIYLLFLYGFLAIKTRIQDLTDTFWARMNGAVRVNVTGPSEYILQFCSKTFFFVWRIVLPFYLFKSSLGEFLLLFAIAEIITGYYLTLNFQVSHISPSAAFPNIKTGFNDEWAVAQVKTTVDYAHGSRLVTFLSGALNYQTVHHLFPSVSQYHYPAIAPIVIQMCKKYHVPFSHLSSFGDAFRMHLTHLHEMGAQPHHQH